MHGYPARTQLIWRPLTRVIRKTEKKREALYRLISEDEKKASLAECVLNERKKVGRVKPMRFYQNLFASNSVAGVRVLISTKLCK
jgi:hypothetical protein